VSAFDLKGQVVNVGDQVSVLGYITAVGSGSNPSVTIQPPLSASTFTVTAQNLYTVEGTARGVVTAISGSGNTAILTITLTASGIALSVPAGACYSNGA